MHNRKPSYLNFDSAHYLWKSDINYREELEAYRVGKGEQGVLTCEPYKSEILPYWRFKTPEVAKESSEIIYRMFNQYLEAGDFVGADMARKFLQMGYTRARRYANYKGGKKYDKSNDYALNSRGTGEQQKAESTKIFYAARKDTEVNEEYMRCKKLWKKNLG